jgi:DNA polymerase-3 subunit gamma/tau
VLGLIGRDLQFEIAETVANEDAAASFTLAGRVVEAGFDLRVVCRELARLVRDLLVIRIDPTRVSDPEIASEGEADRLKALAARNSREDLLRAFDLLARAEGEIRYSSQPRHHFEMALVKWIQLRKLVPIEDLIAAMQSGGTVPLTPSAVRPAAPPTRAAAPPAPTRQAQPAAPAPVVRTPEPRNPPSPGASAGLRPGTPEPQGIDLKSSLLSSVREQNKTFFGMVVAQAQSVTVEGDTVAFTFAPVHKGLRAQFDSKRGWLEHLAQAVAGRKISVVAREGQPAPAAAANDESSGSRKAGLRDRAKAEPTVQAVLDVFGGEIEDVEEIDR